MNEIKQTEIELEQLFSREEEYWRQRARSDWLSAEDRNIKFFHAKATARKKKNMITELLGEDRKVADSVEDMTELTCKLCKNLFSSTNPSQQDIDAACEHIEARLSKDMIRDIMRLFKGEEIQRALFNLGPNKAPGPDGFHALFYQKMWGIVGKEITEYCLRILNGDKSIKDFNKTNIVLIPKKKDAKLLKDFRPIALTSVIYKIIAKCLANRLKPCLSSLIAPNQYAFVPDRQIFDNVIAAFEILHSINRNKQGREGLMAVKLDLSKAYDRVKWSFLEIVLSKMGFPRGWIRKVMDCVTTTNLSFSLNGKQMGSLSPSRGIRQGCPISPYLFLLCAEGLSSKLRFAENGGRGLGLKCTRRAPLVSHLFFADDSILFYRASEANCLKIKEILEVYGKASGQQVNFEKSSITFSPNSNQDIKDRVGAVLGVDTETAHDIYLGLPTMVGRKKIRMFNSVKDRVWKRLCG